MPQLPVPVHNSGVLENFVETARLPVLLQKLRHSAYLRLWQENSGCLNSHVADSAEQRNDFFLKQPTWPTHLGRLWALCADFFALGNVCV